MSTEQTTADRAPVWYIANEKSVIDNVTYEEGQRLQYAGNPSSNLEPTDDEGRARRDAYEQSEKERIKGLIAANPGTSATDADAFAKALSKEMAQQNAEANARFEAVVDINNKFSQTLADLVGKLSPAPAPTPGTAEAAQATDAAADATTDADGSTPAKRTRAAAAAT